MQQSGTGQGQERTSLATILRGCLGRGVVFVNPAARTFTATAEAAELLGLPAGQTSQQSWEKLPKPLREVAVQALNSGNPLPNLQLEVTGVGNGAIPLEISAVSVGELQHGSGVLLVLADLNKLRACEERLQRLDQLANVGTLAASMAHEIKNALVAGKTFVDLLLEKNPQAELADVVRRELTRVDSIVGRLLKFGGPRRTRVCNVRVHDLIDHTLRLLQPQMDSREIATHRELGAVSDVVSGDEGELLQALMNLLLNAFEAMTSGGRLTVQTENTASPGNGSQIRIRIADTGVGIPAANLPYLFDPFFTTKPSGTGLGLAVTRHIILEHHGALSVESVPGQGTSFFIALPLVNNPADNQADGRLVAP